MGGTLEALTALNAEELAQSDTTTYSPLLKAIIITAAGTLTYRNEKDEEVVFVMPSAGPFILPGRIWRVMNTGTDIADANLIGLR